MKKVYQIWAIHRTGLDSAATQPCVAYDSFSACAEIVEAHRKLQAERGEIPAAEVHLIPDLALCQVEYGQVGSGSLAPKQYVLLSVTHIQEAWV